MRQSHLVATFIITSSLFFPYVACAVDTTYLVEQVPLDNGYSIDSGFITTNGTLGQLAPSNIVDYEFQVSGPTFPYTFTPLNPGANLEIRGVITATPTEILLPIDTNPSNNVFNDFAVSAMDNTVYGCQDCEQRLNYNARFRSSPLFDADTFRYAITDSLQFNPVLVEVVTIVFEPQQELTIARVVPSVVAWNLDGTGDWNESTDNWSPQVIPNDSDITAVFGNATTQARTVATEQTVTVNGIQFDNTNPYAIAGNGEVVLAGDTDVSPGPSTLSVLQGGHQFQVEVTLDNDTTVDVASGSTLVFNNALNLNGQTLTKTGDGTLTINNQLNSGGGTVIGLSGMINGFGLVGGSLDNQSAMLSPGGSSGALTVAGDVSGQVPEPSTAVLIGLGAIAWAATRCRRRN